MFYYFVACYDEIFFHCDDDDDCVYVPTITLSLSTDLFLSSDVPHLTFYSFLALLYLISFSPFCAYSNDAFNTCFRDYNIIITIKHKCAFAVSSRHIIIIIFRY